MMKRFDVHMKAIDGVHQKTILGAFATITAVIIVFMLVMSEVNEFNSVEVVNHMGIDTTVGVDAVELEFDISFHNIPCKRISIMQEITRGTIHEHEEHDMQHENEDRPGEGCRMTANIITDKVAGNLRFTVQPDVEHQEKVLSKEHGYEIIRPPDISHTVHSLKFKSKDQDHDGVATATAHLKIRDKNPSFHMNWPIEGETVVESGVGVYHYSIQVVKTEYRELGLKEHEGVFFNQYAVNERKIEINRLFDGVMLGGTLIKDFVGLVISYDFYPVMVVMEEKSESVLSFICGLCGIVGGVVTVIGLLDRFVYSSTKALIGKKD